MDNSSSLTRSPLKNHVMLEPQITWYWCLRVIISLLSIVGNGLIVFLIAKVERLHVTNNWFVLSLAVSDLCVGLFVTSTGLACCYGLRCDWRLQLVFYNFLFFASTLNLWTMTFDRYLGIAHPLKYLAFMKTSRVIGLVAASWFSALFASVVRLFWLYDKDLGGTVDKHYRVVLDIWLGVLSCILLLTVYVIILLIVRKHTRLVLSQRAQISYNQETRMCSRNERERLSARVLGAVVGLFVSCYTLSICVSFCSNFKSCYISPRLQMISILFVHLNSSLNFVAYALLKNDIKSELRRLCGIEFRSSDRFGLRNAFTEHRSKRGFRHTITMENHGRKPPAQGIHAQ